MDDLRTQTIKRFLDALAAGTAAPGGGAGACMAGAMGASLLSMVASLTIGRKRYADVEPEMEKIRAQAEAVRTELTALAQLDVQVINRLMDAYQMPKETEAERARRQAELEEALVDATEVPLRTAEQTVLLFELAEALVEKGNRNAVSDATAGAVLAEAAFEIAVLNAETNLSLLNDDVFAETVRHRLAELEETRDRYSALKRKP